MQISPNVSIIREIMFYEKNTSEGKRISEQNAYKTQ
jgi:hypothetical protein